MTLEESDYAWSFASGLLFDRKFVAVTCPECEAVFGPEACQVLEWSYGEDLAAHGGRRVVCPAGHTLYSCGEWIS